MPRRKIKNGFVMIFCVIVVLSISPFLYIGCSGSDDTTGPFENENEKVPEITFKGAWKMELENGIIYILWIDSTADSIGGIFYVHDEKYGPAVNIDKGVITNNELQFYLQGSNIRFNLRLEEDILTGYNEDDCGEHRQNLIFLRIDESEVAELRIKAEQYIQSDHTQEIINTKFSEAKTILHQIINLEKTYYSYNGKYVAFNESEDCPEIGFTQLNINVRKFDYKFEIVGSAPYNGSLATAIEREDVNGDGDTNDGLTLTVQDVQGSVNDLKWE